MDRSDTAFFGHPKGLMILFFTEMWERFSYYGMRAILVLFLVSNIRGGFGWTDSEALNLYGWYTMMVYVMSIPGGILADRLLGQRRTVILGGWLLVAGHLLLAYPAKWTFYVALGLIVLGVGGLKPNISTMVGGLYRQGDKRRDTGYTIYYMGINTGSFLASLIVSYVGEVYGWHYGFSLAGFGMLLGQITFLYGQQYLQGVGDSPNMDNANMESNPVKDYSSSESTGFSKKEKDRLFAIGLAFIVVGVFWMAFEQAGGLMNLYTNYYTDRNISGFIVPTGTFQALNPGFILVFGGLVAAFWDRLSNAGQVVSGIFKMGIGTIIMGIGFVFMVAASQETNVVNLTQTGENQEAVAIAIPKSDLLQVETTTLIQDQPGAQPISGKHALASEDLNFKKGTQVLVEPNTIITMLSVDKKKEINTPEMVIFNTFSIQEGDTTFQKSLATDVTQVKLLADDPDLANNADFATFSVVGSTENNEKPVQIAIVKSAIFWLILAYLFHTIGELCLSPVSLSFITKVAPPQIVASVMGIYWAVVGFANKLAAVIGGFADSYGELAIFGGLVIFTVVIGGLLVLFTKPIQKLTHGTEDIIPEAEIAQ